MVKGKILLLMLICILLFSNFSIAQENDCGCDEAYNANIKSNNYRTGLLTGGPKIPQGVVFKEESPTSWDWRDAEYEGISGDWTTEIKNQGSCGSCYAFGSYASLESLIKIKSKDPFLSVDLSEQFMVSCGEEWVDGILGCNGAYFVPTFEFLEQFGAIPETCFPYVSGGSGYVPPCSDKCPNWQDLLIEIDGWGVVSSDVESIQNALIQYGPLVTTMVVYDDFHSYPGGIYEHPGSDPDPTNHIVCIVGYDDSQGYWICKNSWGTGWGENGWFRIAYGDCKIEQDTAYLQYTDQTAPQIKVKMHRIKEIGEIDTFIEFGADWSYKISVFNGDSWTEQINNDYSSNEDDHIEDVVHSFNVYAAEPEITIKVWDRDLLSGDDLADVSGYEGGGADNDISDRRGAIFHCKYDVVNNEIIELDTIIEDGSYYTSSGTYNPDGGDNSDEENDAKVWFDIFDTYESPDADLKIYGGIQAEVESGQKNCNLGSFTVENIGEDPYSISDSYLDWEIFETPDWGSNWRFEPEYGEDLITGDITNVEVFVDAPSQEDDFSGTIKLRNSENYNDEESVLVNLKTPITNKGIFWQILEFLQNIFEKLFGFIGFLT